MKKTTFLLLCLTQLSTISAVAQGTFQNLAFESATIVPIPGDPNGSVQFATAFPGWTAYVGGIQQTSTLYNAAFLDTSGISIIDSGADSTPYLQIHGRLIQGNYTAVLMAGLGLSPLQPADTSLSQTGLIPIGTESLQFKAFMDYPDGIFSVTAGGQQLSLIPLATASNYTQYAADISSFAGQIAELKFTAFATRPHQAQNDVFLDSIQFSVQPAPEPSPIGLSILGGMLIWARRIRLRNRL